MVIFNQWTFLFTHYFRQPRWTVEAIACSLFVIRNADNLFTAACYNISTVSDIRRNYNETLMYCRNPCLAEQIEVDDMFHLTGGINTKTMADIIRPSNTSSSR